MTTRPSDEEPSGPSAKPAPRRTGSVAGLGPTLAFGFGSHFVVAVVNVLAVPIYLRLMGAEAYGLVAFYLVLQGWMLLFDLGVSPALARQLSRFRAGALPADDARGLLRAAEIVFVAGGVIAGGVFILGSPWIGRHWLGRSSMTPAAIDSSLRLLGVLLVFRWLTGLYQSALVGLERQNSVNGVALASAVARNAAAVAALALISPSPVMFFAAQAIFTLTEAAVCRLLLATAMPRRTGLAPANWRLLRNEFHFALGLTIASAIAMTINQADKLALSHALPLGEFGLFGLVVAICSGIAMVVPPFVQAFQPRLTTLLAQNRRAEFIHVYRLSAALILALSVGLAGTIAARPEWVIYAWTGRSDLGVRLAPVLTLYAAGSGVASFLFVPFLLQYAQGQVRLQVIGAVLFGVVWIPAAVWAAFTFGPIGTGAVWLVGNLLYLALWVPVIHRRLLSVDERRGLGASLWSRGLALAAGLAAISAAPLGEVSRLGAFLGLASVSLVVTAVGVASSRDLRSWAREALARGRNRPS